jgi:hypothetical protein
MSEQTTNPETKDKPKAIKIGEEFYAVDSLTEKSINLFQDIKKVEDRIAQIQLDISIAEVAKTKLYEELIKEKENLTQVPAPATETKE